jgi:uncharacterized protein YcnI
MKRLLTIVTLTAAAVIAWAGVAQAHVTANPREQQAGGFTKVEFRAPNERDKPTTKIEIQIPQSVSFVSVQPVPGWSFETKQSKLDEPVKGEDGEEVTEYTSEVIFSGGKINPGEFQSFYIGMKLPDEGDLGDYVFFPTLQTYEGGEVVSWTQKPKDEGDDPFSLEKPAPFVTMAAGEESEAAPATDSDSSKSDDDTYAKQDDVDKNVMWLYVISIAALVLALVGLVMGRKRS